MAEILQPTVDLIVGKQIAEGQYYDFKRQLDLKDTKIKSDLLDDVVAFLHSGGGHIIIGVEEKKTFCDRLQPMSGDRDEYSKTITQIIQNGIDPSPLKVRINFLDVTDTDYIVDVWIQEHPQLLYQNTINGAYLIRTNGQNRRVRPDELRQYFVLEKEKTDATIALMNRENASVEARGVLNLSEASTLHIAIVPQQHYEHDRQPFAAHPRSRQSMRLYHEPGQRVGFVGCDAGMEIKDSRSDDGIATSRFVVTDDWQVHSYVTHPLRMNSAGTPAFSEFAAQITSHLSDIQRLLDESEIAGPFWVLLRIDNIKKNPRIAPAFPSASSAGIPRPRRVDRIDEPDLAQTLIDKVRAISFYGR